MENRPNNLEGPESQNDRTDTSIIASPDPESTTGASGELPPVYRESRSVKLDLNTVRDNRCMCLFPNSVEIEYFKVLRTQVRQKMRERGWNSLMVTSALPGEGKTLTAVNLALTFAREYHQTVLLVDCDLRRQQVSRCLGISSAIGLIDYLLDDRPLKDLIVWPGIDKLTLISGGRNVLDTTEILNSNRMRELVQEMKDRYDDRCILFDLPPVLSCADAISFAPQVDGVLFVVETGKTAIDDVQKAVDLLPREKILGFVMNRSPAGPIAYGNG